ncbi:VOC family protein [Paenarthrobacter nitroguajacolicus]|uniref:VOC family protein n=1 Tax=Paenarthrobacter nitroguajacolicus TaxID=211146 RepID=UPI002117F095|nr:VOC family protein [Paenarthrobacter nitroguajacolicus]
MTAPQIYVSFPGTARDALGFYAEIFGGELFLYTFEDFNRTDGPSDAIAHGVLSGVVSLGGSDTSNGEKSIRTEGVMLSLLGAAEPAVLHEWFNKLADGGRIVDPLAPKPWGASDGQVVDRHGLHWLVGYEQAQRPEGRERPSTPNPPDVRDDRPETLGM